MVKTPAKKPTNAPRAAAAPAKKVETPAEAQKPAEAKTTTPTPAGAASGGTGLEPDTTSQGQADMQGKDTSGAIPTDAATAANGVGAVIPPATPGAPTPGETIQTIDVEAIQQEAYKQGYSQGFTDALEGEGRNEDGGPQDPESPDLPYPETGQSTLAGPGYDRAMLIALALHTPENQRKGGIVVVVDRLAGYLDGLDPDDRWPALQMMHAIAQTRPIDLANGRFALFVNEGLSALNGNAVLADESASDRAAAALRFQEAFHQEDESVPVDGPGDLDPDIDLTDADSGAAAAARMAGA